jgi:hypothetical protein
MKFVMNYTQYEAMNRDIFQDRLTSSMCLQMGYLPVHITLPALMSVKWHWMKVKAVYFLVVNPLL